MPFVCTLAAGHGGESHIAHDWREIEVARWPMAAAIAPRGTLGSKVETGADIPGGGAA